MNKTVVKIPSNRLQNRRLKLLDYDIDIKYLSGKYMHKADLLSRKFVKEPMYPEFEYEGVVHFVNLYNNKKS